METRVLDGETAAATGESLGDLLGEGGADIIAAPADTDEGEDDVIHDDGTSPDGAEEDTEDDADTDAEDVDTDEDAEDTSDDDEDASDDEVAEALAGPTHEEVVNSEAGKGLLSEVERLRKENKNLKDAQADDADDDFDPFADGDDGNDPFADDDDPLDAGKTLTAKDVAAITKKAVADALKPITDEREAQAAATRKAAAADGLIELRKDPTIPKSIKPGKIILQAKKWLHENEPAVLEALTSKADPARAIFDYAQLQIPEIKETVGKALTAYRNQETERVIRGAPSETEIDPDDFVEIMYAGLG